MILGIAANGRLAAMAIKGLSLAEKEPYILRDDEAHPDNITAEAKKRAGKNHKDADAVKALEAVIAKEVGIPTTFHIGNLTQADRVEIGDITMTPTMSNTGVSMSMQRMKRVYLTVQRALKGWDNFTDENGKSIAFETETGKDAAGQYRVIAKDECILRLSSEMIMELADAILKKNGMTKELVKNSEAPSQQSLESLLSGGIVSGAEPSNKPSEDAA